MSKIYAAGSAAFGIALVCAAVAAVMACVVLLGLSAGAGAMWLLLSAAFILLVGAVWLLLRVLLPFASRRWSDAGL